MNQNIKELLQANNFSNGNLDNDRNNTMDETWINGLQVIANGVNIQSETLIEQAQRLYDDARTEAQRLAVEADLILFNIIIVCNM